MPARTPTPCRTRGCRALVSDRSGYCEVHQGESWARQRAKPGRKIYGSQWRKQRAAALRRDRGLCVLCRAAGRAVPATEVDHIIAVEHGGTDALSNLQSICTPHHRSKTARERLQQKGKQ